MVGGVVLLSGGLSPQSLVRIAQIFVTGCTIKGSDYSGQVEDGSKSTLELFQSQTPIFEFRGW